MSKARNFMKAWFAENYNAGDYPEQPGEEKYKAKSMALVCIKAAETIGISEEDLRAELGDIEAYIQAEIEQAIERGS
jgi:hypothetical protein